MKAIYLVALFLFGVFHSAKAQLVPEIEPYFGINLFSSTDVDTRESSLSGLSLGGRGGLVIDTQWYTGLDFHHASFKQRFDSQTPVDYAESLNELGLYVGYRFLENFRVMITYYLTSQLEFEPSLVDSTNSTQYRKLAGGSGFRFEASYILADIVIFGLAYRTSSFKRGTTITDSVQSLGESKKISSLLFTIAFPLLIQ